MISICTPTYNRAHTLPRLFESLNKQKSKEFEWIVIDDGSEDNTRELIEDYNKIAEFPIIYTYQSNQGKHIALNIGQEMAEYEMFFCLDSDDWLADNAVSVIINDYENYLKNSESIVGLVYLNEFKNGEIIGTALPHLKKRNWLDLVYTDKIRGDKCYVFKTETLKKFPFPSFSRNKHMPPTYQFYMISQSYSIYSINRPLKYVEYLDDGLSRNIKEKYFTAADNYAYYRKVINSIIPEKRYQLKNIILYNISYIYAENKNKVKLEGFLAKLMSIGLFPISLILLAFYKTKIRMDK